MDFDELEAVKQERLIEDWAKLFDSSLESISQLGGRFRGDSKCFLVSKHCGSFNFCVRMHWKDGGPDWLIRFPIPGKTVFPEEKFRNEVATMKFIRERTSIPVPKVIAHGTAADNNTGLGPFIIMTWIEGKNMKELMQIPSVDGDKFYESGDIMRPEIDKTTLSALYGQMASVLLELSTINFDRIGSLDFDQPSNSWSVENRPFTLAMNELLRYGGLPEDSLSTTVYSSSLDYLSHLSELHFLHLEKQRNSIFDSRDCREKYTCRYLFQSLVPHFTSKKDNNGPFNLFCDDFGPGNVLVDESSLQITGVIDWEFCYTAPSQFLANPPEWLLLKKPNHWVEDDGLRSFLDSYLPKFDLFLQCLEEEEAKFGVIEAQPDGRLSSRMRRSMENNTFWFNIASRKGWSLDFVYWNILDNFFYGSASVDERVARTTSSGKLHQGREEFVRLKIKELQQYEAEFGSGKRVEYENVRGDEQLDHWQINSLFPLFKKLPPDGLLMEF